MPKLASVRIGARRGRRKKSWNFFNVSTTIGKTTWTSSLWPKQKEGVYLIVIKKPVLKKEGIMDGDKVSVTITY